MLIQETIESYSELLASRESVPGGGSATALAGALGAALVSMVCHISLTNKTGGAAQRALSDVVERSETLRRHLLQLVDQDGQVFSEVMSVYRWPQDSPSQRRERREALQVVSKQAASVPLRIVEHCAEIVSLCKPAAEFGNRWVVSDAGVAVLLAEACLHAAVLSVHINLKAIDDRTFVDEALERMARAKAGIEEQKQQILALTQERMEILELTKQLAELEETSC